MRPKDGISGTYRVIAQVDEILGADDSVSPIRMLRDVPPTPLEVNTVNESLRHLIEPAAELGIDFTEADIAVTYPAVVLRPIAIFR